MSAGPKLTEDEFWPEPAPGSGEGGKGGKKGRSRLVIAVVVVVVLVVAGAGAWFFLKDDGDGSGGSSGAGRYPNVYVPQNPDKETGKIDARKTDARPFSEGELFDSMKQVTYKKYAFALKDSDVASDCASVVWGDLLTETLKRGECSQLARGAYLSQDGRNAGQFVAINLVDQKSAQQVMNALDPSLSGGFVKPLPIKGADGFGTGFSAAYSEVIGHYVIMSWVGRSDGATPEAMNEMIDTSLAVQKPEDFAWGRIVLLDPR